MRSTLPLAALVLDGIRLDAADAPDKWHWAAKKWHWAAKRCANEIQAIHPDLLICVQGTRRYNGEGG
jgi:hypothetical protein